MRFYNKWYFAGSQNFKFFLYTLVSKVLLSAQKVCDYDERWEAGIEALCTMFPSKGDHVTKRGPCDYTSTRYTKNGEFQSLT